MSPGDSYRKLTGKEHKSVLSWSFYKMISYYSNPSFGQMEIFVPHALVPPGTVQFITNIPEIRILHNPACRYKLIEHNLGAIGTEHAQTLNCSKLRKNRH